MQGYQLIVQERRAYPAPSTQPCSPVVTADLRMETPLIRTLVPSVKGRAAGGTGRSSPRSHLPRSCTPHLGSTLHSHLEGHITLLEMTERWRGRTHRLTKTKETHGHPTWKERRESRKLRREGLKVRRLLPILPVSQSPQVRGERQGLSPALLLLKTATNC